MEQDRLSAGLWIWGLQKELLFISEKLPLGDPIEITVRGYELSLRRADAENIIVEI